MFSLFSGIIIILGRYTRQKYMAKLNSAQTFKEKMHFYFFEERDRGLYPKTPLVAHLCTENIIKIVK